jgi:hypothetical protein
MIIPGALLIRLSNPKIKQKMKRLINEPFSALAESSKQR